AHPHGGADQRGRGRSRTMAAPLASAHGSRNFMGARRMSNDTLEVRRLSKRFPPKQGQTEAPWILADLSFTVREGEFLTMVGPSGAGKTTLLNIISQVDAATGGEMFF